jgi:hypothetical protein
MLSVSRHKTIEKASQHRQPKANAFGTTQVVEVQKVWNMLDPIDMLFDGPTKEPRCIEPLMITLGPRPSRRFKIREELADRSR